MSKPMLGWLLAGDDQVITGLMAKGYTQAEAQAFTAGWRAAEHAHRSAIQRIVLRTRRRRWWIQIG